MKLYRGFLYGVLAMLVVYLVWLLQIGTEKGY